MNRGDYYLESPYQAFETLRTYQVGRLRSIEYNPDRVQISISRSTETWFHANGNRVQLDVGSPKDIAYIKICLALQELYGDMAWNSEKRRAFDLKWVGVPDPNSDTGDAIVLETKEIAKLLGRSIRTINWWVDQMLEDFTDILKFRGVLNPDFTFLGG